MSNRSTWKVPFGLREGKLHYVSEVETGLACRCVCPDPKCGKPLIARNKPSPDRKRIYHFRHASLTSHCGGRESALHRMGKEVVELATQLQLPEWSAGALEFSARIASLAPGSSREVFLKAGQMRPDVRTIAVVGESILPALYVEIKVSHAVDWEKRERVIAHGHTMLEIDLSGVGDDLLQNQEAFVYQVLNRRDNRRWIHIGDPLFLSHMLQAEIISVLDDTSREKRVPTRSGGQLILQEQHCLAYHHSRTEPHRFSAELADTFSNTQRVDALGNALPYKKGLYVRASSRGWSSDDRYKTHLQPIVQNLPENRQGQLL